MELKQEHLDAAAAELAELKPWYLENADETYELTCLEHDGVIALAVNWPGQHDRGHAQGLTMIPLAGMLLSYRIRTDGSMGYKCQCGNDDVTLKEEAILHRTHAMYPHVAAKIEAELALRKRAPKAKFKLEKVS